MLKQAVSLVIFLVLSFATTSVVAQTQRKDLYVGSKRCAECHPYQYRVWQSGPHINATKELSEKQLTDKRCTHCHMTLDPSEDQQGTGIVGITCERCHGAGKYYQFEYIMKDSELRKLVGLKQPDAQFCASCHDDSAPTIRPFHYETDWAVIDHRTPQKSSSTQ